MALLIDAKKLTVAGVYHVRKLVPMERVHGLTSNRVKSVNYANI
jgi:hypothetical protein